MVARDNAPLTSPLAKELMSMRQNNGTDRDRTLYECAHEIERLQAACEVWRARSAEDEATAIAALQRNLEMRIAHSRAAAVGVDEVAQIVRRALASTAREFSSEEAAVAILALFGRKVVEA